MSTINQLIKRSPRVVKKSKCTVPALRKCPQKKGVVSRVTEYSPKKPNSARRKVAKVKLSTGRVITCYIPGEGHNLQEHSIVLIRGGRCQDVPGIRYKPIRGIYDLAPIDDRRRARSKYGRTRPSN